MKIESLKTAIRKAAKGSFATVRINKRLKTRKEFSHLSVTKVSLCLLRQGIVYDNQKAVIAKRESGESPAENAGLPWGQWDEFPYFITHKGATYVRLYLSHVRPRTRYFCNGKPITKAQAQEYCLASEFRSSGNKPDCITVKAENIRRFVSGKARYIA